MKITTENLGKRFNREWIFKNLNYTFEAGNSYAIVGPNGSGKSTLLHILWGQSPASLGSIHYSRGEKIIPVEKIFQFLAVAAPYQELIEEFTLREMVDFHFKFKEARNAESTQEIIDRMELNNASGKLISNFSTGMRQRLKLALAFFSDCPILFLDEPTTNLDKKSVAWYWEQFRLLPPDLLILIASNQEHEYPETAQKLDISTFK